jgi:hypothetical protein
MCSSLFPHNTVLPIALRSLERINGLNKVDERPAKAPPDTPVNRNDFLAN